MSEHESHDNSAISALYRRVSHEEPPPHLDERVMAAARRHAARHSRRWWLPLSSAAVVVLAVSLLLRHQQRPDEMQRELAKFAPAEITSQPAPAAAPPAPFSEQPRKETRALTMPAPMAKSRVAEAPSDAKMNSALSAETEKKSAPPAEAEYELGQEAGARLAEEAVPAAAPAPAQTADMAEEKPAERARSAVAPQAAAGAPAKSEEAAESPERWLRRIEALRAKGELEAARRELAAFRKAYPAWPLPKELQALLPAVEK